MAAYNAVGTGLNLAGGVASLALTQRRTGQEKMMSRIARGEQDPALAALRRSLIAQNARSAMALAASQPGLTPAQAARQAQMGLAEANAGAAGQIAGVGAELVGQARAADTSRRRRDALGLGIGQLLSQTGGAITTMGAANAAQAEQGKPEAAISGSLIQKAPQETTFPQGPLPASTAAAQASLASAVRPAPAVQENQSPMWDPTTGQQVGATSGTFLAAPYQTPPAAPLQIVENQSPMWDPTTGQQVQPGSGYALAAPSSGAPAPAPIPAPAAPPPVVPVQVPPGGSPQGQFQMASGPGSGAGGLGQLQPGSAPPASAPASWAAPTERPIASTPAPAQPAPPPAAPARRAISPLESLPEQVRTNPQNAGLMQMYEEYMRAGKQREARAVLAMLQSFGSA